MVISTSSYLYNTRNFLLSFNVWLEDESTVSSHSKVNSAGIYFLFSFKHVLNCFISSTLSFCLFVSGRNLHKKNFYYPGRCSLFFIWMQKCQAAFLLHVSLLWSAQHSVTLCFTGTELWWYSTCCNPATRATHNHPSSTTVSTDRVQNTIQQGETKQATEPKWSGNFSATAKKQSHFNGMQPHRMLVINAMHICIPVFLLIQLLSLVGGGEPSVACVCGTVSGP